MAVWKVTGGMGGKLESTRVYTMYVCACAHFLLVLRTYVRHLNPSLVLYVLLMLRLY
jgi:hypothetical protein